MQAGMQLQEQFCRCRKMLHYKQELPRRISSKILEDTMLYKVNVTKHVLKQWSLTVNHIQPSTWWASVLWFWIITDSCFTRVTWVNNNNTKTLILVLWHTNVSITVY